MPTPCTDWSARDLVEHVIGFHEVLWLRPTGIKARRPRDDPAARWRATQAAIAAASTDPAARAHVDDRLLSALTTDVLVHTWDLARAIDVDPALDAALCERALAAIPEALPDPIFAPAVSVASDADVVARLVAACGRDPGWTAP